MERPIGTTLAFIATFGFVMPFAWACEPENCTCTNVIVFDTKGAIRCQDGRCIIPEPGSCTGRIEITYGEWQCTPGGCPPDSNRCVTCIDYNMPKTAKQEPVTEYGGILREITCAIYYIVGQGGICTAIFFGCLGACGSTGPAYPVCAAGCIAAALACLGVSMCEIIEGQFCCINDCVAGPIVILSWGPEKCVRGMQCP